MRNIGAGPAHVETDELLVPQRRAGRDHTDHAASRAGQDRILATERADFRQPAVRLHEAQPLRLGKLGLQSIGIAPEHRREVSIDHCRIAARDEFYERADFVAHADLRKADVARDGRNPHFMVAIFPAVHQDDRKRVEALAAQCLEIGADPCLVERLQDLAIDADPLGHFDHAFGELFGQDDMARENLGPGLRPDTKRIAEPARN